VICKQYLTRRPRVYKKQQQKGGNPKGNRHLQVRLSGITTLKKKKCWIKGTLASIEKKRKRKEKKKKEKKKKKKWSNRNRTKGRKPEKRKTQKGSGPAASRRVLVKTKHQSEYVRTGNQIRLIIAINWPNSQVAKEAHKSHRPLVLNSMVSNTGTSELRGGIVWKIRYKSDQRRILHK